MQRTKTVVWVIASRATGRHSGVREWDQAEGGSRELRAGA
jgi:hypothetical protein